ncbi:LAETG motif-containing sortase-dependent surface protein [Streptomyces sp. NPDC004596]|uniref:LAETG motif-containing sortase-dependent surface protein n=1 Tax=Streptomyces sp. DSM 118148 TaxID=3448667 RepID=UPI00403FF8E3
MSSARRPLLTATAAGTLLCALWFVPSANASQDDPARAATGAAPTTPVTQQAKAVSEGTAADAADTAELADTGSFDTTPYVAGGSLFLAVGAGFVVYSVRRERLGL